MINELLKFEHCKPTKDLNYTFIPCTVIDTTEDGMRMFNKIIEYVESLNISKIIRTRSGGLSNVNGNCYRPRYDLRCLSCMFELTLILFEGCWRIQFRNSFDRMENQGISGKHAFWKFADICKKYGINIQDYRERDKQKAIENKNSIEKYIKKVVSNVYLDKDLNNVYHIDINSSFMANMVKDYNEFLPVAEELYYGRKDNPIYKGVMTNTIGYFQSDFHNYGWAHLSRSAVNGNNKQVNDLIINLRNSGRIPILINTDGIWYAGEKYHDSNEGNKLGQWKHDHENCTLLIKSPACYQYKENGKIYTVMSGRTKLDKIKPRENWEWGDIYNRDVKVLTYILINNRIVLKEV